MHRGDNEDDDGVNRLLVLLLPMPLVVAIDVLPRVVPALVAD